MPVASTRECIPAVEATPDYLDVRMLCSHVVQLYYFEVCCIDG